MYLRTVLRSKPRLSAIARSGRPAAQCSRTSTTFATRKLLRPMATSLGQEVTAWFQAAAWSAGDELAEHQVGELPEQISRRLGELIERRHLAQNAVQRQTISGQLNTQQAGQVMGNVYRTSTQRFLQDVANSPDGVLPKAISVPGAAPSNT